MAGARAEHRDRVVVVAERGETVCDELEAEPDRAEIRPSSSPLEPTAADPDGTAPGPSSDRVRRLGATVVVLDRDAQATSGRRPGGGAARVGVRVRTLSLFYEEWLGKLPVASWSGCRCCSTSARCTAPATCG